MLETREIYKTLDLCLRVGEVLLSSGAGAADVTATMLSLSHGMGLRNAEVDVTFTALSMSYQESFDDPALIQVRNVRHRDIDYEDLTEVDHLITAVLTGELDRDEARQRLARIVSSGHRLPRWAVTLGWGVSGLGIGLLLGGDLVVATIAFLAAAGIDLLKKSMSRRRLPVFYQQVAGGLLATSFAVGTAATNLAVDPSLVITANIIMLLSGIGFMGAIQDALSGFYITAGARLLEALLATAGIIAGVSGGLTVGSMLGVEMERINPGEAGWQALPVMAFGAGLAAAAFAFACYAPLRSLLPIAATGAVGASIWYLLFIQDAGPAWSSATAAGVIGLVSYSLAGRVRVPPLVVVVPAIVPLLPGLSIYRGLSLMSAGDSYGIIALATAAAVAIALASGVILGEYIAQPLKREVRRLEDRLAGPRLVGPIRARAVKRQDKGEDKLQKQAKKPKKAKSEKQDNEQAA
ncbi:MAG TPA: threonine/serine exporter family protein [Nocardioidaceae bacterium]|nr:threonine/serine exporter family protein [Nocardioidaceae bacterium]